jgi:hypothetical protein
MAFDTCLPTVVSRAVNLELPTSLGNSDLAHPTEQRYTRSEKTVILDHGGSFLWPSDIHTGWAAIDSPGQPRVSPNLESCSG